MVELCIVLAVAVTGLIIALLLVLKSKENERLYLREAVFESWVRETKSQCRKWAMFYKKMPPIVEVSDHDGIKQIYICNLNPTNSERVKLATININFNRHGREVYVSCSKEVANDPMERWSVIGGYWTPKTLILRDELWKHFIDDPEIVECNEPNHIGSLAAHAN